MCVILYYFLNNDVILAKNRDRNYKPKIKIVHELYNGIEVVYMYDYATKWIEGLNEFGFGIINSSLEVDYDENPLSSNIMDVKEKIKSQNKYLDTISQSSFNKFQSKVFDPSYYKDVSLQGHTIIANPYYGVIMESNTKNDPVIMLLDNTTIRANHGINMKNTGYIEGIPYLSSVFRQKIIESEFKKYNCQCYNDVFNLMNKNYYDLNNDLHPYRNNSHYFFTTSQLILNLTKKEFIFNYDKMFCNFVGIENKLPSNYKPKIKIKITTTTKNKPLKKIPLKSNDIKKITNHLKN